jgi:hypothetical protein
MRCPEAIVKRIKKNDISEKITLFCIEIFVMLLSLIPSLILNPEKNLVKRKKYPDLLEI